MYTTIQAHAVAGKVELDEVVSLPENTPLLVTVLAAEYKMPPKSRIFGCLKGSVIEQSDIVEPTGEKWDAE